MKARSLILSAFAALISLAPVAQADIWAEADDLYSQRDNNREIIAQSRAKYLEALSTATSTEDKLRAVSQLGRLAIYEGEMLLAKNDAAGRRAVFSQCWCATPKVSGIPPFVTGKCDAAGFVDKISKDSIGVDHPAYAYFHGVCLAYWGEQGSLSEKLAFTSHIVNDIKKGQLLDTRFEGGGINRLGSGVYSNPATKPLGIYNPTDALALANKALGEQPFPGDPSGGSLYFDNWQAKVSALMQLHVDNPNGGFKAQAVAIATQALSELDQKIADDDLPYGREPEAKFNYNKLKTYYKELTGTDWP